jgi:hypothetical protein
LIYTAFDKESSIKSSAATSKRDGVSPPTFFDGEYSLLRVEKEEVQKIEDKKKKLGKKRRRYKNKYTSGEIKLKD